MTIKLPRRPRSGAAVLVLLLLLGNTLRLNAQTLVVGSVNGVFDVSDLGGANYSIPIKLPTGIGGLQPALSINYNSQGNNGILGMGWSLSGLSAITRSGNNLYNDNMVQGTALTGDDRFSLDGARLILISDTSGAAGSRYATETESYKLIDAVGTSGSGPLSFTITGPNGWVYTYGGTVDSRVMHGSEVISWLVSKVVDLNNNEITYTYSTTPNETPDIVQINYNGNSAQGLAAQTQVYFYYASRPDANFSYVAGKKLSQKKRLSFLTVAQTPPGGTMGQVRKYKFEYDDDIYTHLDKVEESAGLNLEKVTPTNIDYGAATSIIAQDQSTLHTQLGLEYIPGDFNSDGKTDYMVISSQYEPSYNTWQLMKNIGNSFTKVAEGPLPAIPAVYDQNYLKRSPVYRNSTPAFFDFNNDGKDDFVYRFSAPVAGQNPANGPTWDMNFFYILVSDGTGLAPLQRKIIPALPATSGNTPAAYQFYNSYPLIGDFDGNGKNEILVLKESNKYNATAGYSGNFLIGEDFLTEYGTDYLLAKQLQGMPFDATAVNETNVGGRAKLFVIDYDGDGKNEILSVWQGHAQVFKMNVTFDANKKPIIGNPAFVMVNETGYPSVWHDILTGDFNGDGITDVLTWAEGAGWEVGYGNGKGLMNDIYPAVGALINKPSNYNRFVTRPVIIGDYDGDGKDDIFDYTASVNASVYGGAAHAPKIHYSRGNNSFQTTYPAMDVNKLGPGSANYVLSDCNGDGALDFLTRVSITTAPVSFCFHPNENRQLVTKITNGLGAFTNINYGTLTNTAIYQPGSLTNTYPVIRRTLPLKVVSSVVDDNGINLTGNTTTFKYEGLKYAVWGRGMLGFDKVTRRNNVTLASSEKTYALNTTYFLTQLTDIVNSVNGTVTDIQKNEYGVKDFGNKRIFPYITRSTSIDNTKQQNIRTIYDYTTSSPFSPDGFSIGKPFTVTTLKGFKDYLGVSNGNIIGMTGQLEKTVQSYSYPNWQLIVIGQPPMPYHRRFLPNRVTTTQNRTGNADYTRATSFQYNDAKGWVTQSIQDPGTTNAVTTGMTYNGYGNLVQKTVSAAGLPTVTDNYDFDPSQRFISKTYNSAYPALASVNTYDAVTGNLLTKTDPDGLQTTYTYDAFGRSKTVSNNNGTASSTLHQWASGVPNAKYQVVSDDNISEPTITYFDRLGRKVRQSYKGINGEDILVDMTYNAKGQQETQTIPRFSTDATTLTNTYQYDLLGRPTLVQTPTGNTTYAYVSTPTSGDAFSGSNTASYKVTVTNPANQAKSVTTDAAGRNTIADDPGGQLTYTYNSVGGMKTTSLNGTVVQSTEYDNFGRKTKETDPNYGTYTYTFNAYNQILTQKDPQDNQYSYTYDAFGNIAQKSGAEGNYTYTHNFTGGDNALKLTSLEGPGGTITYNYGKGEQLLSETRTTGSESFANTYVYDAQGRVAQRTYPDGATTAYAYSTSNGSLVSVGIPGETYSTPFGSLPAYLHTITHKNALGQVIAAGHGSAFYSGTFPGNNQPTNTAIWSTFGFDPNGLLTSEFTQIPATSSGPGVTLKSMQYTFNTTTGNLTIRKDVKYNKQEYFSYDNLNRLGRAQYGTPNVMPPLVDLTYAANGNINRKSDAGTFTYDVANRVSEINPYVNIPAATQATTYTEFNKIKTISEDGIEATFTYWPDGERASMELTGGANPRKVYYAPGYEKIVTAGNPVRQLSYIDNGDKLVAILERKDAVQNRYYVLTDYLGSITQIMTVNGTLVEEKNFDAWGRQRVPSTWLLNGVGYFPPTYASNDWNRGYTGHEMIPEFGIINMNGRLYDPLMGRMFSPDPYIMGKDNTQGYNRYSYALNNPLSYTDPNGEIAWFIPVIAGAVIGGYMGGTMANGTYNPTQWDYSSGKTWGYIAGGAIVGAASGAIGVAVAGSGMPFANTVGIALSSFVNSVGTTMYTGGQTDVLISFGAFSYNVTSGEVGFLGKNGNSLLENIGYGLGALANLNDLWNVSFPKQTGAKLYTDREDPLISHTAYGDGGNGKFLISFGPDKDHPWFYSQWKGRGAHALSFGSESLEGMKGYAKFALGLPGNGGYWDHTYTNFVLDVVKANRVPLKLFGDMAHKIMPYQGLSLNCVNMGSIGAFLSGIPNIGLHPWLHHASMWLYTNTRYDIIMASQFMER